jgi:hypothetical protein
MMILGPVFEQFVNKSPISVMARATVEHALCASALDDLFDHTADRGYTKELLFSTTVNLMSLVVCGKAIHVQSAFQQLRDEVPVTLKSVYEKQRAYRNPCLCQPGQSRCRPLPKAHQ